MEYIANLLGMATLEFVLTLIAFAALGYIVVRRTRAKHNAVDEELGEDVPPEFPGSMRPRSFPKDFGKSPGRK